MYDFYLEAIKEYGEKIIEHYDLNNLDQYEEYDIKLLHFIIFDGVAPNQPKASLINQIKNKLVSKDLVRLEWK
jgi:hypothetical protein